MKLIKIITIVISLVSLISCEREYDEVKVPNFAGTTWVVDSIFLPMNLNDIIEYHTKTEDSLILDFLPDTGINTVGSYFTGFCKITTATKDTSLKYDFIPSNLRTNVSKEPVAKLILFDINIMIGLPNEYSHWEVNATLKSIELGIISNAEFAPHGDNKSNIKGRITLTKIK